MISNKNEQGNRSGRCSQREWIEMGILCSFKKENVTKTPLVNQLWLRGLGWIRGCEILSWWHRGGICSQESCSPKSAPIWPGFASFGKCLVSVSQETSRTSPGAEEPGEFGSFYPNKCSFGEGMSSWCIHEFQRWKNSSQSQLCSSDWLEMTWTLKICHPNPSLSPSGRAGWDLRLEEPPD